MRVLKRRITNKAFEKLEELQNFIDGIIQKYLTIDLIKSITRTNTYQLQLARLLFSKLV